MYMIRKSKRRHNHMVFVKLLNSISNPKAFWNHSRAIFQQKHGRRLIPVEFVEGEDNVPREALRKWDNAFRDLLSPQVHSSCQSPPVLSRNNETDQVQQIVISIDEDVTYQAILSQKNGKATGSDRIPSEVLKYMLFHLLEWCCWFIRPTTRGRVAPEGGGRINRNTTTKGGIKCLLPLIGRC